MATATIANGFTQLHACDAVTGVTGNAIAVDTAVYKENSASLSFTMTSSKNTVDVTTFIATAAWSAGDCVRFWFNFALPSEVAVAASGGIKVELTDGTNTAFYQFLGSDNYGGGWVLGSIDIATGTILSGTRPTGTLTAIGIEFTVTGTLRNSTNLWVDNVHIGSGYSVYGGTDGDEIGMDEILTADIAGGWGLVQKSGGVYFINGKLNIGDDSGTNATYFLDAGNPLSFTHIGSVPSTAFEYAVNGNTTGVTDFDMSGFFIQGDTYDVNVDFNNANIDVFSMFGCTFKSASAITFTADTSHTTNNCIFDGCGQIEPSTSTFKNNTITNYVGTDGGVLWPSDDGNISGLTFIVCDNDIEIDSSSDSAPSFVDILHDDNSGDYDVNNTSGSARTVALSGTSNGNSYNPGGSTVTFSSSATLSMTVKDEDGNAVGSAFAYIDDNNETPFIMNTTTNVTTGIASVAWTGGSVTGATWRVRKYGYKPYKAIADVPASGAKDIPVTLVVDPQQT